jgi:Peptidase family M23
MSFLGLVVQIAVPLFLLAWMCFFPARGVGAFAIQALSTGFFLLGLSLVAMWLFPPWWFPYACGVAFLAAFAWQISFSRKFLRAVPPMAGWRYMLDAAAMIGLGLFGAYLSFQAFQGRRLPNTGTVDIAMPFSEGVYLVGHGGSNEMINAHVSALDPANERYRPWRGQSYALDLIKIDEWGLRTRRWRPEDPERYDTFRTSVVAPCAGTVAIATDGLPDMKVPERDRKNLAGNHVILQCEGFAIVLAHLRQGSVAVSKGQALKLGDKIGEVGNSGNTSEPHLHIHAQRNVPDVRPLAGTPLGLTINGTYYVRNDRIIVGD